MRKILCLLKVLFTFLVIILAGQFTYAQEENSTTLEPWRDFRYDLKTLASWDYKNITKIAATKKALDSSCLGDGTCIEISAEWEAIPVYARYDETKKTIYYYTTATKIYLNPSSAQMLASFSKLSEIDMTKFDTTKVVDMSSMFDGCSSLTSLNVSKFDTSNVTNMSNMFKDCKNLTTLDVSKFDTRNVTGMDGMFYKCSGLTALDVSGFITSNVIDMNNMFRGCSNLTGLDVSNFDTSNVTDMNGMFNWYKWANLDVSNFDTKNVTNMNWMFNGYGWNILDITNFDTSNVTDMASMFYNCNKLTSLNVSKFDTNNVTDVHAMFQSCSQIEELDLTSFNTIGITNMNDMFNGCSKLATIYVSDSFVLGNTTSSTNMFINSKKLVWWNGTQYTWTHVTWSYAVIDNEEHPGYFSAKDKESIFLPWEKFNVKIKTLANWTGMTVNSTDNQIISIVRSYENPQINDLEVVSILWSKKPIYARYDSGTIFYYTESEKVYINPNSKSMFQWLSALKNLDLTNVYTNNVTDMRYMFSNCESLETLDLDKFDTSNVTNMERMFNNCRSLETLNLENFNTSNVTNMNYIFNWCESLETLNLENFNTSNVERMRNAFSYCESIETLDLGSFDTSNVENMNQMFLNAKNLTTIYVSDKFVTTALSWSSSENIFSWDINLVWWNGTIYNSSMIGSGYAVIDKEWQPWYFTDILDRAYNIIYNLDGWIISWERTTYTQRDTFTLPSPTKEWYNFIWWTWSNGETLTTEVVIAVWTKWDLEYTANWKLKDSDKWDSSNYSWWWGSRSTRTPQSTENDEGDAGGNKQESYQTTNWDDTGDYDIEKYDPNYSLEQNEAYQFAYKNWITTKSSIIDADMMGPLNRISMAKMLSNYAINVLWKKPANKIVPKFSDITDKLNKDYGWAVDLSYQLWIMWIWIDKFRPYDEVTRAEFWTAFSRMLFGLADWKDTYYSTHLAKLKAEWIISNENPNLKEIRAYVMIMLMRSANK